LKLLLFEADDMAVEEPQDVAHVWNGSVWDGGKKRSAAQCTSIWIENGLNGLMEMEMRSPLS
jgi:hypothetical protein